MRNLRGRLRDPQFILASCSRGPRLGTQLPLPCGVAAERRVPSGG